MTTGETEAGIGSVRMRRRAGIVGGVLLASAVIATPARSLLLLVGLAACLVAALGSRLPAVYRGAATMLLNTVLLLVAFEVAATAVLALGTSRTVRDLLMDLGGVPSDVIAHHYLRLPYYEAQDWSEQYWSEHQRALRKRYDPYVLWRSPAFEGELLNIDARGVRRTPGGECSPGALKVYALGGSAMWGWGAPDWGTIPAYLQRELSASLDEPVCVVNYAEQAFVSTQDLVQLQLLLAAGEVPDHVILYSGVNDVFAAEQNGAPLLHQNLQDIVTRFERPGPSLLSWLMARSTVRLAQTAVSVLGLGRGGSEDSAGRGLENGPAGDGSSTEELADAVVDAYVRGYESVAALAEAFGFGYDVVWQPHILIGGKSLTAEEQEMPAGLSWVVTLSPRLVELFRLTSGRVQVEAAVHEHLHYLGDAFDEVEAQLWIDTWGHVTPEGNEIVAGHLASLLRPSLGR